MAKTTLAQAQAQVDSYIQPSDCFVVYQNNKLGWAPLEGTPCAHYVAHLLGIKSSAQFGGYGCNEGYELRVRPLVAQLKEIALEDVQENDVWARMKGDNTPGGGKEPSDHCGIVLNVEGSGASRKITIRHDSSGQHKIADNDWSYFGKGGKFYRKKGTSTVVAPAVQLNQVRAKYGIPMQAE